MILEPHRIGQRVERERVLGRPLDTEEVDLGPEREDEVVVGHRLELVERHLACVQVDGGDVVLVDPGVVLIVEEVANGVADGRLLEQARCHLVQQRLERVVVVLVHDHDLDVALLQLLRSWEEADRRPELVEDGALNVVVVGGGPTGVETAGAMAELYNGVFKKDYPDVPHDQAKIILVEAGPELFPMFKEDIREYTEKALAKRGVEVMTGEVVESITPQRVTLKSGTELRAHTLVWGAGLQGNELVRSLGLELEKGNRIGVDGELRVPSHPEVYAVGDVAAITDQKTSQVLPQLGSVALQSGEHAGKTIAGRLAGKETKPFKYHDKGTMAAIGRGSAVVQMLGGRTMKGKTASLAWGTVHLALLPTNEDRAKAVVDWAGAGLTHQRSGRITVET